MSLDGGFLHIVKTELTERNLIGARVEKIHQPSRDEIVLTFRTTKAQERLLISSNAMSARVCITCQTPENPATPPMFCTVLRKHIGSGRLTAITQSGLERVLNLDFAATNEIGDSVSNRLVIEIMGRTSNIILLNADSGRIIDSIKRFSPQGYDDASATSQTRRILPNLEYQPPPRDFSRHCLLDCDIDGIEWGFDDKSLLKMLEGVSPIFVREAVFRADGNREKLIQELYKAKTALIENKPQITLVSDKDGSHKDFCFVEIKQYGSQMITTRFGKSESKGSPANELLDSFFKEKADSERLKQRSGNIMKWLNNAYERLKRKIETQKLELNECKDRERLRMYGDLINANIYKLQKGSGFLEAENYETGQTEKIKLDVRLTPAQNAQKYYAAYRKLNTAEKLLTGFIRDGEKELTYLDSVIDSASRAGSDAEINAIREEMGMLSGQKSRKSNKARQTVAAPVKFNASDGTEILVGRNNKQNDELTFKIAKPDDIWLHTKDIAGSHVILRCSDKGSDSSDTPTLGVIEEAAVIAAEHSKGRKSSRVPVDYTFVKYVKKPSGSKPGYVIFTHNKTLYVNPRGDIRKD